MSQPFTYRRDVFVFPYRRLSDRVFETFETSFNTHVPLDHQGFLEDRRRVAQALGRTFGSGAKATPMWDVIQAAGAEYRQRRTRSAHPLRRKTSGRLKTVPVVGPLAGPYLKVLRKNGVNPKDVRTARIRRTPHGYVLNVTLRCAQAPTPKGPSLKHHTSAEVVGATMTNEGLLMDIANLRQCDASDFSVLEKRQGRYLLSVEKIISGPKALRDVTEHLIMPKGILVALDMSLVPTLSGESRGATTLVKRWFRSRKAVGTIDFRLVSTLGGEAQDASVGLEQRGYSARDINLVKTTGLLNCPECGCLIDVRLSATTGAPVGRHYRCSRCGRGEIGWALAHRSRVQALDGMRQASIRQHSDPRRRAKSTDTTTSSTTTTRRHYTPCRTTPIPKPIPQPPTHTQRVPAPPAE